MQVDYQISSRDVFMTKFVVPVNFQSVSRSKALTQRNQVSRQKMNVNTAHICLCVASSDTNRLLNQGKHTRCQCQPQMVTGPIMTWPSWIWNVTCAGERLCLSKPHETETTSWRLSLPQAPRARGKRGSPLTMLHQKPQMRKEKIFNEPKDHQNTNIWEVNQNAMWNSGRYGQFWWPLAIRSVLGRANFYLSKEAKKPRCLLILQFWQLLDWGDTSASKVLAVQAWKTELDPQKPRKKEHTLVTPELGRQR